MTRNQVTKLLEKKYPNMFLRTTESFNGVKGGIWTSGEDGPQAKNGYSIFNYYSENYTMYTLGVHLEIAKLLEEMGWYAEFYDAGTVMLWPE